MLEIFVLFGLVRTLRQDARARGASEWWAALGPLLWIGGELGGAFVSGALGAGGLAAYLPALGYAIAGAYLSRYVVARVPGAST